MLIVEENMRIAHENRKNVCDISQRKALIRKCGRRFRCMRMGHRANGCNSAQKCTNR